MTSPDEAKTPEVTPAERPDMGGLISEEGASFRVWAPHADAVYVAGDFNDWSHTAHPLAREEDGCWSVEVPGVKAGAEYKFLIVNGEQALWRYDPYARAMTSSVGNSILYVPDPDWEKQPFDMPAWNELVIYEMHVGTLVQTRCYFLLGQMTHRDRMGIQITEGRQNGSKSSGTVAVFGEKSSRRCYLGTFAASSGAFGL